MKSMPTTPEVASKIATSLGRSTLFQEMDPKLLAGIAAKASLVQIDSGEFITREGEKAEAFFVFINGQASVLVHHKDKNDDVELAQLGPGDTVGEIALLLALPYGASVKAISRIVAARYDAKFFEKIAKEIPDFGMMLAKTIGRRFQKLFRMIPVPEFNNEKENVSTQAFNLLPIEFIRRHRVIPIKKEGNTLTLGFVEEPSSVVLQGVRSLLTGIEILPVRIEVALFESTMRSHSGTTSATGQTKTVKESGPLSLEKLLQSMITVGNHGL